MPNNDNGTTNKQITEIQKLIVCRAFILSLLLLSSSFFVEAEGLLEISLISFSLSIESVSLILSLTAAITFTLIIKYVLASFTKK